MTVPSPPTTPYVPESFICANCGQSGHYYKNCAFPICSFGIICFRLCICLASNALVPQYIMVQRKDSLMFVEFVRGKYAAADKSYIMDILNGMTRDEQERLKTQSFTELWQHVWGKSAPKRCLAAEHAASVKLYEELRSNRHGYTLPDLVSEITTCIPEREWGFPKGRRNIKESDDMCALREFNEETGIHGLAIHRFLMNFEEHFVGSNGISYKHKYYLARLIDPRAWSDSGTVNETQAKEITCTKWMTYAEVQTKVAASKSRLQVIHAANLETMRLMACGEVYCG